MGTLHVVIGPKYTYVPGFTGSLVITDTLDSKCRFHVAATSLFYILQ
jgi:hypothetical protein